MAHTFTCGAPFVVFRLGIADHGSTHRALQSLANFANATRRVGHANRREHADIS
jgi:hypothetical protein